MKRYIKIPLITIGSIAVLYICFIGYIKLNNPNPLYMDYRYSRVIIQPLAKLGFTNAQFKAGLHYLYGWGITPPQKDLDKAVYWLEKAVENGHVEAVEELRVAQNAENYPQQFM